MLAERAAHTLIIAAHGASVPLPSGLDRLARYNPRVRDIDHNPDPETLADEILTIINQRQPLVRPSLDRNLGLKKLDILAYYSAFADQHGHNLKLKGCLQEEQIEQLISKIENHVVTKGKPTKVTDQLSIALDCSNNNLTDALLSLAVATRIMARNFDKRLLPGLQVDVPRMLRWKKWCIAGFDFNPDLETEMDVAGDTYHFWEAALAGYSTQQVRDGSIYDRVTAAALDKAYERTGQLTEIIRYKVFRKKGKSHFGIDVFGYHIGRLLASKNDISLPQPT